MAASKTVCKLTHKQFREHAKPLEIVIDNNRFAAEVKEFSTGSLGWYLNGKTSVTIDGVPVAVQIGVNLTIVGSKEVAKDQASPPAAERVATVE